jgi:hypothetical protein
MLDQAFEALQTYDWGVDPKQLDPIGEAVITTRADAEARAMLESRLAAVLPGGAPRAAKDYACRQLRTVGTAASVPALAKLLADEELSHMARYALERIPAPDAGYALRTALADTRGELKIGVIASLGVRGEESSVAPLAGLLADPDKDVAAAAAQALGAIGSTAAVKALAAAKPGPDRKPVVEDALLACAEHLAAKGMAKEAKATYDWILGHQPSARARDAAQRGLE